MQDAFLRVFPEDGFIFLPVWEKSGQEWPTSYSETSQLCGISLISPSQTTQKQGDGKRQMAESKKPICPSHKQREYTKLDGNQEKKEEGKQNKHLTLSANNDIDIDVFIPNENHKRSQEDIRGGKLAHPRTDSSLVRGGPSSLPRHGKRRLRAHSK